MRKVVSGIGQGLSTENRLQYQFIRQPHVGADDWPLSLLPAPFPMGEVVDFYTATWPNFTPALTHLPDLLIEGVEDPGNAPAYRGTACVVFDDLGLEMFGNRLQHLTFEVFQRVSSTRRAR